MWKVSLPPGAGPGPSLVLLLLCSLVLSGVLAYQAQDAARSHRAASESALRDYAALATDELTRRLDDEVDDLGDGVLFARWDAERRRSPEERLQEFAEEVREDVGSCDCPELLHDYFTLDLREGSISFLQPTLAPELGNWISATVRTRAASDAANRAQVTAPPESGRGRGREGRDRRFPDELVRVDLPDHPDSSLLYAMVRDDDGGPLRAYGLVIERGAYAAGTTRAAVAEASLLPPSLTRGAENEEMLSLSVMAEGETLFDSGGAAEAATRVTETLETPLGVYLLKVAVRPDMADRLVIGGLPRSRLPLLLGIFLLTLGLSAIAIVQLRRQQALVRLRSEFVASVSHELRTPLAQIRLFSDLLRSGRLGDEQRARSVRIIGEEAQRLAYLVENVLRFSRSGQRPDRVAQEPTDLAALTHEIVEGFAPLAHARQAGIETELEWGSVAALDRDAVRQVLLNLLDNAVKYGPPGQTVRVGVAREGARVRLSVEDEGPGIPPADRSTVWEPYHRLRRDIDAATGGSGIGLAVVSDLVGMHGGTVAIESASVRGSRFLAWFPALLPRPLADHSPQTTSRRIPA